MSQPVIICTALIVALAALWRAWRDHKTLEGQMQVLREKLEYAQRMHQLRGTLAEEVAHDIKNPLTAIVCSAEALHLLLGDTINEIDRRSLQYIQEYGEQVLKLVGDFIDISQAETGNLKSSKEVVEVISLTSSVVGLLSALGTKRKITINVEAEAEELFAYIDRGHLKQILFNLIHNAIKFSAERSAVTVRVQGNSELSTVGFEVRDNGCGISAEHQERLFLPYSSRHAKDKIESQGSGLGLALCKLLCELEQSMIAVQSQVGVGTTFSITVPMANEFQKNAYHQAQNREERGQIAKTTPLEGKRILVIDSDEASRQSVARLIEAWGGIVDTASRVAELQSHLSLDNYSAMVVDRSALSSTADLYDSLLMESEFGVSLNLIFTTQEPLSTQERDLSVGETWLEKPINSRVLLSSLLNVA